MRTPRSASAASTPLSRTMALLAGLAILGVAISYAFHIVFSRSLSQDEGYLMITIQSFLEGNPLYDSVFTQYGPFYYFYEWIVHGLLSVPLTHDATRLLCLFHWLSAAALLGVAALRITRSAIAGLFVFMQAFVHLTAIANEPGHPQELVVILLAVGMLVAASVSRSSARLAALAFITALLAFTKINVGLFFGLALVLAQRCQAKDLFSAPAWRWLLITATAFLPVLLMRQHFGVEWCRNYSLLMVSTVFAAGILGQGISSRREFPPSLYGKMAISFLLPAALFFGLVAWTGTSPQGLVEGLFITPLKMPRVALLPLPLSNLALLNAALSLGLALAIGLRSPVEKRQRTAAVQDARAPWTAQGLLFLKAIFGIAGAAFLLGKAQSQIAWLLPWAWLVLVPARAGQTWFSGQVFPRVFLALTAAWQGLQAYPIAGTQATTATFLLTLAFTLCLHDSLSVVQRWKPIETLRKQFAPLTPARLRLVQGLGLVALLYLFTNVWCRLGDVRREYARLPALDLPGSRFVHMDAEIVDMYRELSAYLEKECDTFVTYPGINSLYFWTGKRPPTHLNSTGWGQLSHAQQTEILNGLRRSPRPLLVVVAAAAQSWSAGVPEPILPLVRYVTEDCREVKRLGRFILFVPNRHEETAQRD